MLFLGEDDEAGIQTWVKLKINSQKPKSDQVFFFTYNMATRTMKPRKSDGVILRLPMMYPFKVFPEEKMYLWKEYLVAFVRYMYREGRQYNASMSRTPKDQLVDAFRLIAHNYAKKGGMSSLLLNHNASLTQM
jgi:hypothetical protein